MADGAFTQFNVASDIINSIDSTTGTVWSGNAPIFMYIKQHQQIHQQPFNLI